VGACESTSGTVLTGQIAGINTAIVVSVCRVGSAVGACGGWPMSHTSKGVVQSAGVWLATSVRAGCIAGVNLAVVVSVGRVHGTMAASGG
jgi:hypothetical protein